MAYFVTIEKVLADKQYSVKLSLKEVTANDKALFDKYGPPTVDFGGPFTGPPAFTLNSNVRNLETGLPVLQIFDGVSDTQAESKANVWETEMRVKLNSAMSTLRANNDTFTSSSEAQF